MQCITFDSFSNITQYSGYQSLTKHLV